MKKLLGLLLLLIPSVALATPQSDLMTQVQDTTNIGITMGDPIFQTQSLRLLDAIRIASGGGGGGVSNITGINGVAPSVGNGVSGTGVLRVTIASDSTGQVTANAGTNLNTSTLAVETGGNLASIKTDVDNLNLTQGSTTSGQKGNLNLGAVTTAAPTYTTAQSSPLSLTTAGALRVDNSGNTQPVSGTVTTTPPVNASTNLAQVAGTTIDTNSGTKSAGTMRVVLATDQPVLTNKLLVTPDSVALPANQSVNVSQINAVTPLMGNGVTGTGSQRVTIASDNTAFNVNLAADQPVTTATGNLTAATQTVAISGLKNQTAARVQITGTYSANLILEGTIDGVNYNSILVLPTSSTGTTLLAGSITSSTGDWVGNIEGYTAIQVRCNTYTSGTAVVSIRATNGPGTVFMGNALPTSTNTIGNIGTIATSVTPGTGAANLGKAEDAASANGDTLVASGSIRRDTPVANANTSTDGDYTNVITDNFGRAWTASVETPVIDQGLTQFRLISAASTNATVVKASQGNIYGIEVFNNAATAAYLKFYNVSSSPTVGTTTTNKVIMVPANGGMALSWPAGIQFSTGISLATTTNLVDNDTTGIAINQMAINVDYK